MGGIFMKKLLLFLAIGTLSFSKYKIECKPIYWKDMDSLDKNIYLILKKYNKGKEPTIKQCRKINDKEIKNEKK
jgi:hypothetical protein